MGKEILERQNKQKAKGKMAVVSLYISTIMLNVNELNSSLKGQRVASWIKTKQNKKIGT